MIPPVPLVVRLAMAAVCIIVSKAGFALAGWIVPELKDDRWSERSDIPSRERKP